jgi:DNA-directed RNA polymerase specialized sigma24 family protein
MVTSGGNPVDAMNEALKRVGVGNNSGVREFYAILFQTFWESLIRFLRYRREATLDDAQVSVSNLMFYLYERALAGKFADPPRRWQAYLRKAAVRQYEMDIHKARRATPRARDVDLALALFDGPRPDLLAADRDAICRMFERAHHSLTLMEQRVIAMRGQRWSYAEIAESLYIAECSVGALASRARKKLKVELFKLKAA